MRKKIHNQYTREIEVEGHLIDSMILTKIFDRVMDLKGDFEVKEFVIGSGKKVLLSNIVKIILIYAFVFSEEGL